MWTIESIAAALSRRGRNGEHQSIGAERIVKIVIAESTRETKDIALGGTRAPLPSTVATVCEVRRRCCGSIRRSGALCVTIKKRRKTGNPCCVEPGLNE